MFRLPDRNGLSGRAALLRRLPVLAFVALGVVLYRSALFPQERLLRWQTGGSRAAIRTVELQLWSEDGTLLRREHRSFPSGAPGELALQLTLAEGHYAARFVIDREGQPQEGGTYRFEIGEGREYVIPLGRN